MKTYTEDDVRKTLKSVLDQAGLRNVSGDTSLSVSFLSAVSTGKKRPSPKLAGYLGYERVVEARYRRKASEGG